jgi:hypothetical protein
LSPSSSQYYSKYGTYRHATQYSNSYFQGGFTYAPLYAYYLPPRGYIHAAYYSTLYGKIYTNGYGFNFYYKKYGYYEYSVNPVLAAGGAIGGIIGGVVVGACCCCFACWFCVVRGRKMELDI